MAHVIGVRPVDRKVVDERGPFATLDPPGLDHLAGERPKRIAGPDRAGRLPALADHPDRMLRTASDRLADQCDEDGPRDLTREEPDDRRGRDLAGFLGRE